jgi:hypothetical protein
MRITRLALVLLCAVAAVAVPSAAFAGGRTTLLAGLYADVARLPADHVRNSLTAKLDAAQAAIDRGQPRTAINQLNAFGHELHFVGNPDFVGNPNLIGNPGLLPAITEMNDELVRVISVLGGTPS